MIMPHKLDVNWMKSRCKLHLEAIVISTWCDVMSFTTKILSNLFKVTKGICSHTWHLQLKNSPKNQLLIWNFLVSEFWFEQSDIDLYKIFSLEKWPKFAKIWKNKSKSLDFCDKFLIGNQQYKNIFSFSYFHN